MTEKRKTLAFNQLATGVPGLDTVLGGGLPEYSFNIVAGEPGSGKTTLVHQLVYANATEERPALYFTALGEPSLKMLRYQQQMAFFDPEKVGTAVRFVDLTQEVLTGDLERVLTRVGREVKSASPSLVVVDSFRTVTRVGAPSLERESVQQGFVQRLAMQLTSWQVTSFLIGEYVEQDLRDNPVFTVADGILWLSQERRNNSVVRKLEVRKLRGQPSVPGLHSFRITSQGVHVFPREGGRPAQPQRQRSNRRVATGVQGLDAMLGGGLLEGDSTLVAGPSGAGKTVLSTQFIAEGLRQGEHGVMVAFEEHPADFLDRARGLGLELQAAVAAGQLRVIYLRPLDLSVDEAMEQVREAVEEVGARRLVIDSLTGFEVALAPTFREEFREALYRTVGALTGMGVTVLLTIEVTESFQTLHFSPHAISFLTENILLMRYVELEGALRRMLSVVKMRRSPHSPELREYAITASGLAIGRGLADYQGLLTGAPVLRPARDRPALPGLTAPEERVMQALLALGETDEEALAQNTGLAPGQVRAAVERLLQLDYALRSADGAGAPRVRPLARGLGP
jgi:circadian clock protein KaiC